MRTTRTTRLEFIGNRHTDTFRYHSCGIKKFYATEWAAELGAIKANRVHPLYIYECKFCFGFHLTKMKQNKR